MGMADGPARHDAPAGHAARPPAAVLARAITRRRAYPSRLAASLAHLTRRAPGPPWRARADRPVARHLLILGCYLAAGVAVTWPRASYLTSHELPAARDAGAYVWCLWWMAHQVQHLGNPWFTRYLAAPVGTQLGLHVLIPLDR
jgi:hypothetical protein